MDVKFSPQNWLQSFNDHTLLRSLLLPGTHDTMTADCALRYYKTQTLDLSQQLQAGVRFVDLRITRDLVAAHREWISDISATRIFDTLCSFLQNNPSETIIARLQNANEKKDDFELYLDALHLEIRNYLSYFATPIEDVSKIELGEARGKIIAFECAPVEYNSNILGSQHWAYLWHQCTGLHIQDLWDGPSLKDKQEAIIKAFTINDQMVMNHISATNGELKYPDAYASILNSFVEETLRTTRRNNSGRTGVAIYDFITPELAELTIKSNFAP